MRLQSACMHIHIHVCIYIYMYAYTYTCTHIHHKKYLSIAIFSNEIIYLAIIILKLNLCMYAYSILHCMPCPLYCIKTNFQVYTVYCTYVAGWLDAKMFKFTMPC